MQNFKDYFSFEDFQKIEAHYQIPFDANGKSNYTDAWRDENDKLLINGIQKSLGKFLMALHLETPLLPVLYSESHENRFSTIWNKFIQQNNFPQNLPSIDFKIKEDERAKILYKEDMEAITYSIAYKIIFSACYYSKPKERTPEKIKANYEQLIKKFNDGNLNSYDTEDDHRCSTCAQRFVRDFTNWQPKFSVYTPDYKNKIQPNSCFEDKITTLNIKLETGNLLVADWFRIEEFSAAVKSKEDETISINFTNGRVQQTKIYLEKFNFICVSLSNTSPFIIENGNQILVGDYSNYDDMEDEKKIDGFKNQGRICTDLWAVSIIEKEQLVSLIAKKVGIQKAQELVIDCLAENDIKQIKVTPGNYKLNFHGNYEDFSKHYKTEQSIFQPYFTLENIDMKPKLKSKKKLTI